MRLTDMINIQLAVLGTKAISKVVMADKEYVMTPSVRMDDNGTLTIEDGVDERGEYVGRTVHAIELDRITYDICGQLVIVLKGGEMIIVTYER
jgi:hypothetical protein